jgi:hypothetical protein
MWLKFGVAPDGFLTGIDEVGRGKTNLACLYCGGSLTAKKGSVKEHHFAHARETCKPVSQRIKTKAFPALPLYAGGVTKIAKSLTESGLQPSSPVDKSSVYLGLKSLTVQQERRSCPDM